MPNLAEEKSEEEESRFQGRQEAEYGAQRRKNFFRYRKDGLLLRRRQAVWKENMKRAGRRYRISTFIGGKRIKIL